MRAQGGGGGGTPVLGVLLQLRPHENGKNLTGVLVEALEDDFNAAELGGGRGGGGSELRGLGGAPRRRRQWRHLRRCERRIRRCD
jgi:hypothetical protein